MSFWDASAVVSLCLTHEQSEALRDRIRRKKEEEASKTPVKMVPVIMLFVMPLILCPMLGPAVITIMQALGPVFGGK